MRRRGFSLIEVLIATVLLGLGVASIFQGISACLAIVKASRDYQGVPWALSLGNLIHPVTDVEHLDDLVVDEEELSDDTGIADGYTFSRSVDEKVFEEEWDDDGLYVMRTKISWGTSTNQCEEVVEYIYKPGMGEYKP